jgi:hypothetical protein
MLRITTEKKSRVLTLLLEGRLEGPELALLLDCWRRELARSRKRRICLDLTSVTFIGPDGKALLARLHKEGTGFVACDQITNAILAEILGR